MYKSYVDSALERIFTDKDENGFWDQERGLIIERLIHNNDWIWKYETQDEHRYGLFTLSMILLAVENNNLNIEKYNKKLIKYLNWVQNNLEYLTFPELTYGALLSLVLGIKLKLVDENIHIKVEELITKSIRYTISSFDNQNFLVLISAYFYNKLYPSLIINSGILLLTKRILDSTNEKGLFQTGDLRYCYHQRLMYTIWGLIHSSYICYEDEIYKQTKKLLNYVWQNRRQKVIDNAFLWHPKFYLVRNRIKIIPIPIINIKSSKYLFECHQTFFVNAVCFFNKRFNENYLIDEQEEAIKWIFGENRMNMDLTKITQLNIPNRMMTTDNKLIVEGNNFKGSYEVGSYILALTFLK